VALLVVRDKGELLMSETYEQPATVEHAPGTVRRVEWHVGPVDQPPDRTSGITFQLGEAEAEAEAVRHLQSLNRAVPDSFALYKRTVWESPWEQVGL
jgi:hypothetical protein